MLRKKNVYRRRARRMVRGACPFCEKKEVADYKDYVSLSRFVSERGKILGRDRTGVCSRHQRRLSYEIKRARFLALLPFVSRI